jgi:hypothetical protein
LTLFLNYFIDILLLTSKKMGGFGSEYDLEKGGFLSVGEDSLSYEDRIKMVAESGYLGYDLEKEEDFIKNDKKAKPVDWVLVRNSVFTVLNMNGIPEITLDDERLERLENRKEIKRRARNIQEIKHQRLMKEDPEYAEEQKHIQNIQLALSNEYYQQFPLVNPCREI